jgi:hypothetical protein
VWEKNYCETKPCKERSFGSTKEKKKNILVGVIVSCGCGKRSGGSAKPIHKRPVSSTGGTRYRSISPTDRRNLLLAQQAQRAALTPTHTTAARRDIERKRRIAIQQALGK